MGGTALRLLHGLDRFSEDLDFDAPDLDKKKLERVMETVLGGLQRENIPGELYKNFTKEKYYFELRFPEEKLVAYLGRKQTQARDIYDLVWLRSILRSALRPFLINEESIDKLDFFEELFRPVEVTS